MGKPYPHSVTLVRPSARIPRPVLRDSQLAARVREREPVFVLRLDFPQCFLLDRERGPAWGAIEG
jgi:hypothetical protein